MIERVPITKKGYEKMVAELKRLKEEERPRVAKAIEEARALGDLSENAEYHAAREKMSFLEAVIRKIEDTVARAEVIDPQKLSGSKVMFGATVTLIDQETEKTVTYQIVGEDEADIEKGLLSVKAPLGRALIGKEEGDEVTVKVPAGKRRFIIEKVEYR